MSGKVTRRSFLAHSGAAAGGAALGAMSPAGTSAAGPAQNGPHDFIVVEGHRDIWEFNDRFRLGQDSPLKKEMLPRFLDGGLDVIVMPVGGDAPNHRAYMDRKLEGSLQVLDMLLVECEKTDGKASILKSKADLPTRPSRDKVLFFMDLEGGSPIEVDPETDIHPDRRLALLRDFYRLGVRGLQLTHHARNQLAAGTAEGDSAGPLSRFGVEVVQELNRLGMMIGVSHLSPAGIAHVAEITSKPIASTHTNVRAFVNTPRQHTDEDVKAIASTGGVVGIRYIQGQTSYELLADQVDYLVDLVGIDHVGIGWLGHDRGHPKTGVVPGHSDADPPTGVEAQSIYEHWSRFLGLLRRHGYAEEQIALILGGNFLRIWREILVD